MSNGRPVGHIVKTLKRLEDLGELDDMRLRVRLREAEGPMNMQRGSERQIAVQYAFLGGKTKRSKQITKAAKQDRSRLKEEFPIDEAWWALSGEINWALRRGNIDDGSERGILPNQFSREINNLAIKHCPKYQEVDKKVREGIALGELDYDKETGEIINKPRIKVEGTLVEPVIESLKVEIDESKVIDAETREVIGEGGGQLL